MMHPPVLMMSLWRDDMGRDIDRRADHLLSKTYPNLHHLWVVGDSDDLTFHRLCNVAHGRNVTLLACRTGIAGDAPNDRLRRLSDTGNMAFDYMADDMARVTYWLNHESDIQSPPDVVERLVAHAEAGRCPVAGWPTLGDRPDAAFYDIWAYRKDGKKFESYLPYHPAWTPDAPFEVDSAGTVLLIHADDIYDGARYRGGALVDLCEQLKERGRRIWVDPSLRVVQPIDLWQESRQAVW